MDITTWPQAEVWCVAIISVACVITSFFDLFRPERKDDDSK